VSSGVSLNELVERRCELRLLFEDERQPENREQPETIRNQHVVQQIAQFGVRDRSVVLTNGTEHRGVRVTVMSDQIAQ
jgi:hypothetical protein